MDSIKNSSIKKKQLERCISIEQLIYSKECRMKFILKYFDEEFESCNKCDNCLEKINSPEKKIKEKNTNDNVGIYFTYLILKTLKDLDYGCGSNNLIGIIYGSKNKKINDKMRKLKTFGIIKKHPDDNLSEIVRKIQYLGLIEEKKASGFATFLTITELGKQWLKKNQTILTYLLNY